MYRDMSLAAAQIGQWPSFLGQDPFFFLLDSDLLAFLPYVTLQTSKWHSGGTMKPILDMCFQRALWSVAKHESVLWNHPECSPVITGLRFAPSTKIKKENFHRHCNPFGISSLGAINWAWKHSISLSTNSPCLPCYDSNQSNIMFFHGKLH